MRQIFTSDNIRRNCNGSKRPPLRTTTEMAQEFGVSLKQLAAYLSNDIAAPKPVIKHLSTPGCKNAWYNQAEMRTWWKGRPNAEVRGCQISKLEQGE